MRIDQISVRAIPPIKLFEIQTTSNVVVIAGANGSGKTRLKEAIANSFRQPQTPQAAISLTATREEEERAWGSKTLQVQAKENCQPLRDYLATRTRSKAYTGTVIQIDSNRAVTPVKFEQFTLATVDPDDEDFNYSWYLSPFTNRWQQLVNKVYKKVANRDQKIATFIKENPEKTGADALTKYPDPFAPYQAMFERLLPGKTLEPIDPKAPKEFHYRVRNSGPMPFGTLSSGEQEVVKVAFDLVWKRITHSVIMIDEPELHLHPTLTFRLIETLKEFGGGTNQLFLFTHSSDLISTYYATGNVFFVDTSNEGQNQAHKLSGLSAAHASVTRAASSNLGMFAVGKRLIFIEGKEASVDRLVYHKVAQSAFPDSYVLPIGSVDNVMALRNVVDEIATAIFGIDLFLIRDRDGLPDQLITTLEQNQRFRCLPRRHIENYLLDEDVLSEVAGAFYLGADKRDPANIRSELERIASGAVMSSVLWNVRETIRVLGAVDQPTVRDVDTQTPDQLADGISNQVSQSIAGISDALGDDQIRSMVASEHATIVTSLQSSRWIQVLPGKIIFARFCGEFLKVEAARVREAYADIAMRQKPTAFGDIIEIMALFKQIAEPSPETHAEEGTGTTAAAAV